jgi:hypothetical protein
MSTTERLTSLVSEAKFSVLPPEVVDVAKVVTLDGLDTATSRDVGKLVGLLGTVSPPSSP